jgi:hypothetical protein
VWEAFYASWLHLLRRVLVGSASVVVGLQIADAPSAGKLAVKLVAAVAATMVVPAEDLLLPLIPSSAPSLNQDLEILCLSLELLSSLSLPLRMMWGVDVWRVA